MKVLYCLSLNKEGSGVKCGRLGRGVAKPMGTGPEPVDRMSGWRLGVLEEKKEGRDPSRETQRDRVAGLHAAESWGNQRGHQEKRSKRRKHSAAKSTSHVPYCKPHSGKNKIESTHSEINNNNKLHERTPRESQHVTWKRERARAGNVLSCLEARKLDIRANCDVQILAC